MFTAKRGRGMARRSERTFEQWRELIQGWPGSGLTQAEYCERHGVSVSSFYRWRERLRQEANAGEASLAGARSSPACLLPVQLAGRPSGAEREAAALTLVFPNGLRLEIAAGVEVHTLGAVIDLVQTRLPA
jgi:transposase-like protein